MREESLGLEASLLEAVQAIEATNRRIATVVAEDGRLLGTLTDGDIRRCLLNGGTLETRVGVAMNHKPLTAPFDSSSGYQLEVMRRGRVAAVPLIDPQGRLRGLTHYSDITPTEQIGELADFDFAVIMAGGEGMRLRPLTENIPKAMVDIGGIPLLERQLQRLAKAGIRRIFLSVNYLGHIIEEHFGDGSKFQIEIRYIREQRKLGTGGALSLLPEIPKRSILVMNGDILTTFDFGSLSGFHKSSGADITVAAVEYNMSIPYGVIHNDGPRVTGISEKPAQRFLCNAGIYAVQPAILGLVPDDEPFNMTDLINTCLNAKREVAVFPVHEYWSDIGTPADLEKARITFSGNI